MGGITLLSWYFVSSMLTREASVTAFLLKSVRGQSRSDNGTTAHQGKLATCGKLVKPYHVLLTADNSLYEQWQSRIAYFHYKKQKAAGGPCSEMGGFTRLLHTGLDDALSGEIPTVVTKRLDPAREAGYRASNRPYAVLQLLWSEELSSARSRITENYILLMEPDQLLTKPLPNLASTYGPMQAVAFEFWYMRMANHSSTRDLVMRHLPKAIAWAEQRHSPEVLLKNAFKMAAPNVSQNTLQAAFKLVQPTGPSPVIIHRSALRRIAPAWLQLSVDLRHDSKASQGIVDAGAANDWVSEMWAYSIAAAGAGVRHALEPALQWELNGKSSVLSKSASDQECAQSATAYFLHFAFPLAYSLMGEPVDPEDIDSMAWRFDKHAYRNAYPPAPFPLPPFGADPAVTRFTRLFNEGEDGLNWPHRGPPSKLLAIRSAQSRAKQKASAALESIAGQFVQFATA